MEVRVQNLFAPLLIRDRGNFETRLKLKPRNSQAETCEMNVSEQQLKGAPKYGKYESWDWSDRSRGQSVYGYYGVGPYWGS